MREGMRAGSRKEQGVLLQLARAKVVQKVAGGRVRAKE